MSGTLKTVLISLGTSLVVSFITFVLGLRSGKNQADRQKIQELYKQLYAHFEDLKASIQDDRCKTWDNYEYISRGNKSISTPLVRKLDISGDLLYVKKRIANRAKKLETEIMQFGKKDEDAIKSIHEIIVTNLQLFKPGYQIEGHPNSNGRRNRFETASPVSSVTIHSYRDLCSETRLRGSLTNWSKQKEYGIEYESKGNPPKYSFVLYPDSLNVSIEEFVDTLIAAFNEKVDGFANYDSRKKVLLQNIDKIEKRLRKRAREPFSFWETVFGAFIDMFR